jgi:hypothetical protein
MPYRGTPVPGASGVAVHDHAGPLGRPVRVPWLEYPATPGTWVATLVELSAAALPAARRTGGVGLDETDRGLHVDVEWPDGVLTNTLIPGNHTPRGTPGPHS